jgi:DNA polymerase-4/protein ImuB
MWPSKSKGQVACLRLPNFCWQAEALLRPSLLDKGRKSIITGTLLDLPSTLSGDKGPLGQAATERVVLDFSPGLTGVVPGMPLAAAMSRHKEAALVEADVPRYRRVFERVLDAVEAIAPGAEDGGLGTAYVGIWGLEGLYGDHKAVIRALARSILPVLDFDLRIGVGENKWLAYLASTISKSRRGCRMTGEPGSVLAPFPVDLLPVPYETVERLHSFGLHTLGAVADLDRGPVEAQFGRAGTVIWELSNGIDPRPVVPRRVVESVSEYLSFPDPTVQMSVLVAGLESLLAKAFSRPEMARRYARAASLHARVFRRAPWSLDVTFKEPVGRREAALLPVKAKIDSAGLHGPLEDLRLTLSGLSGEPWRQESVWKEVQAEENLRQSLSQLGARLGGQPPIYKVRELEPWSRIPERRHALVRLGS